MLYTDNNEHKISPEVIDKIVQALVDLRFGSVQITVQDYRVVQIDKTEKVRFSEDTVRKNIGK
ncbi:MAG: YezD family protein [Armatimonadota bacterium]